jgi:hypothetical protein
MENNRPIKVIIAGKNFIRVCDYLKTELPEISLEMVESKNTGDVSLVRPGLGRDI